MIAYFNQKVKLKLVRKGLEICSIWDKLALMYQTLSFYKYVRLEDPAAFRQELWRVFTDLGIVGRIYVASEGINAQISVPREKFSAFDDFMKSKLELADVPYKMAVEEL